MGALLGQTAQAPRAGSGSGAGAASAPEVLSEQLSINDSAPAYVKEYGTGWEANILYRDSHAGVIADYGSTDERTPFSAAPRQYSAYGVEEQDDMVLGTQRTRAQVKARESATAQANNYPNAIENFYTNKSRLNELFVAGPQRHDADIVYQALANQLAEASGGTRIGQSTPLGRGNKPVLAADGHYYDRATGQRAAEVAAWNGDPGESAQQRAVKENSTNYKFTRGIGDTLNPGYALVSAGMHLGEAWQSAKAGDILPTVGLAMLGTLEIVGSVNGLKVRGASSVATAGAPYRGIVGQVPGRVLSESDALTVGPLGNDLTGLPGTFSGGRYATMQLDQPMTVYRAWAPGQSREFGAFWSLEQPAGSLQTRIDSALLPEWGNIRGTPFNAQATQYTTIQLPAGTTVHIGEIGSQGGSWVGGKSQLLIDGGAQTAWKIGESPLK